jgi:hypothetical protein
VGDINSGRQVGASIFDIEAEAEAEVEADARWT